MDAPETELHSEGCYVALTRDHINVQDVMDRVRSPAAGAIVMFAGERLFSFPPFLTTVFLPPLALPTFPTALPPEGDPNPSLSLSRFPKTLLLPFCPDGFRSPPWIGTTRDNFGGKPVKELQYSAYNKMALASMLSIAQAMRTKHDLRGVAMIHRLGVVPIGEESILIAVSAPHRQAAWRAGEEALEECKARVEVWKREEFEGEDGVWRANRDGIAGVKITGAATAETHGSGDSPTGAPSG